MRCTLVPLYRGEWPQCLVTPCKNCAFLSYSLTTLKVLQVIAHTFAVLTLLHTSFITLPCNDFLVPRMQHILLPHTFIWAMYSQLTALYR